MRRPAWSGPPPNHLGVVKRVINNSIQERWPSGDPFVRHAFFGKYSDFQTNTVLNDGNRRRSASMEYCVRLQIPARNAELEVSASKASVKQAWVHRRCPSIV